MLGMSRSALASGAQVDDAVADATKAAEHSGVVIETRSVLSMGGAVRRPMSRCMTAIARPVEAVSSWAR